MGIGKRALEGLVSRGGPSVLDAYDGQRVLITGHTGFKGSWLTVWLSLLRATVTGFALAPEDPSLFLDAGVDKLCDHRVGDIRDARAVSAVLERCDPQIVFHLAAQALVSAAHDDPLATFEVNVMGTLHLLEAVRRRGRPCAVVIVTSDKCYRPSDRPHRESDPLGGDDPYSASKAAVEVLAAAYRTSYLPATEVARHGIPIATVRAGNVIGGGDWAADRIVPDTVRALMRGVPVTLRNPDHVRPWQHVLEPLDGYLRIGAGLLGAPSGSAHAADLADAWNFGPGPGEDRTVRALVESFVALWGSGSWVEAPRSGLAREVPHLRLDSTKARERIAWAPHWTLDETLARTVRWYRARAELAPASHLLSETVTQIRDHMAATA